MLLAEDSLEVVPLLCDAADDLVLVLAEELVVVAGCFVSLVDLFTVLLVLLLLFSLFTGVVCRVVVVDPVLLWLVVVLLFTVPLFVSVLLLFTVPLLLVPVDCCVRFVLFVLFTVPLLPLFVGVVVVLLFVLLFTVDSLPLDVEVLSELVVPLFTLVLLGALAGRAVLSEFLTTSGL